MSIDPNSIGQDRPIQNPQTALEQSEGTYKDAAESLPPEQKYPMMPQGPAPQPFGNLGTASGKR